ncbi:hypothetical protein TeGR_g8145 [Tetraparma gracilis]|uniref:Uncharacterized protein n=1 Tax=Tetraparma gracilis TaxID=2962635 RepID=A0ABQ6ND22_9STRA|nr:hypothetical protein TeGR_g8145 [Tetraparma gracilis]
MSVDAGAVGGIFLNLHASVRTLSRKQIDAIPDIQIKQLTSSFSSMIKGSKNIKNSVKGWCAAFLPPADAVVPVRFLQRLLASIAVDNVTTLKLARWGAALRLGGLLVMSYQDVATDVLVGKSYYDNGDERSARISFGILGVSVFFHVLINYAQNIKKKAPARILGLVQAALFLTPLVESYNHWTGKEQDMDEVTSPIILLILSRAVELVVESVPESVLQLGIVLDNPASATFTMKFSIFASLAAAGAIMTETNISYELSGMNKQVRGRDSHPFYGLIPAGKVPLTLLHLGLAAFHIGYLATSLITITSCKMAGVSLAFVGVYMAGEFAIYITHLWRTGRKYIPIVPNLWISTMAWFVLGTLMQNFVPLLQLRADGFFGGKLFSRWILWRLTVNSLVFAAIMRGWEEDGVRASASLMAQVYCAAVGSAVVGIAVIFACVEDSHRWTLYRTRQTPKKYFMDLFNGVPHLVSAFQTRDGQALDFVSAIHPSFFEKDAVRTFLLSLSAKHALFAGDSVLPEEAGAAASWTYDHLFEKLTINVKFYEDAALTAEIELHFQATKAAIAARNEARRNAKASAKALQPVAKKETSQPVAEGQPVAKEEARQPVAKEKTRAEELESLSNEELVELVLKYEREKEESAVKK